LFQAAPRATQKVSGNRNNMLEAHDFNTEMRRLDRFVKSVFFFAPGRIQRDWGDVLNRRHVANQLKYRPAAFARLGAVLRFPYLKQHESDDAAVRKRAHRGRREKQYPFAHSPLRRIPSIAP
jgi:hypothetical protein